MAPFRGTLPGLGGSTTFSGGLPGLRGYANTDTAPVGDPFASSDTMAMIRDMAARQQVAQALQSGSKKSGGSWWDHISGFGSSALGAAENLLGKATSNRMPGTTRGNGPSLGNALQGLQTEHAAAMSGWDQVAKALGSGVGGFGHQPRMPGTSGTYNPPSLSDALKNITQPSRQLSGGDVLKNQDLKIGPHAFPGSGVANFALGAGVDVAGDPITYLAPGESGGAAGAANAVSSGFDAKIAEAIAQGDLAGAEKLAQQSSLLQDIVRSKGLSGLSKEQAAAAGVTKGMKLHLPLVGDVPLTSGEGPLANVSVARHLATSALGDKLLGTIDETGAGAPSVLGRMFGGSDAVAKAVMRGGGDQGALQTTISRLLKTEAITKGTFTDQLAKDLSGALKGKNADALLAAHEGDPAALAHTLLSGVEKPSAATRNILNSELHNSIADRMATQGPAYTNGRQALADYVNQAGPGLAQQQTLQGAAAVGLATPAQLSPEAATQAGLAHQGAVVGEAQANAVTTADQAQAAHEAASTARATQSPKLIAQAEQASGGTPQAASYSPAAAPGSPSASAPVSAVPPPSAGAPAATQGGSELPPITPATGGRKAAREAQDFIANKARLQAQAAAQASAAPATESPQALGLQGLDQAPTEGFTPPPSKATQALAAAQGAQSPEAQAAAAAVKNEIAAVKETLASNPKSGPARYSTPYKVKMWAHAQALGINTDQSATRIEAALKKVVREQDVGLASPAFDQARAAEAATKETLASQTPEQAHAAVNEYHAQMASKVGDTPAARAVIKADTQAQEATLRAQTPSYAQAHQEVFHAQLQHEIASGRALPQTADVLAESQRWGEIGAQAAASGDKALAEAANLNQVALEVGHQADLTAAHAARQGDVYARMLADPKAAATVGNKLYSAAHDFATQQAIQGYMVPQDAAESLLRVHEAVAKSPGTFGKTMSTALRYWKTQALMRPGFVSRLVFGHALMNTIDGVGPGAYSRFTAALANDGKNIDPEAWDAVNSLRGMGQAKFEVNPGNALSEPTRGGPLGKALQSINPLSPKSLPARAVSGSAEHVQSFFRGAMAFHHIVDLGETVDQAAAAVSKYHFNYGDLSNFDRSMRNVVPFWTYMKNNVPLQIQLLADRPGIAATYLRAKNSLPNDNPIPGMVLNAAAHPISTALQQLTSNPINTAGTNANPFVTGTADALILRGAGEVGVGKSPTLFEGGHVSGHVLNVNDQKWPSFVVNAGKALGIIKTNKTTGIPYTSDTYGYILNKFMPEMANYQRLTSSDPKMAAKRQQSLVGFLTGMSPPPTPPTAQEQALYAKLDAKQSAKDEQTIAHELNPNLPYPKYQYPHRPSTPWFNAPRQSGIFHTSSGAGRRGGIFKRSG